MVSKAPKAESLEAKFKLMTDLPYDKRVKRKHVLVYGFILDWYHSKYGNALASVRHIVATIKERDTTGEGLYTGDVHSALTDLVSWKYLEQIKGSGRKASRYIPVWPASRVLETPNTKTEDHSVRETPNICVREIANTTTFSVLETPNKDPLTVTRLQTGLQNREIEPSARSAPHAPVLKEAGAAVPVGGFEELWRAYGFRRDKAAAKQAYESLDPDACLHAAIVESAKSWGEAWEAQCKADAPRRTLAKWLKNECFDEDPPKAYQKKKARAANDNRLISYRRDAFGITVLRQGCAPEKITDHLQIEVVESEADGIGIKSDDGVFVLVR